MDDEKFSGLTSIDAFKKMRGAFDTEKGFNKEVWENFVKALEPKLLAGLYKDVEYHAFFAQFLQDWYAKKNPKPKKTEIFSQLGTFDTAEIIARKFPLDSKAELFDLKIKTRKVYALYSFGKVLMLLNAFQIESAIEEPIAIKLVNLKKVFDEVLEFKFSKIITEPNYDTERQEKIEAGINELTNQVTQKQKEIKETFANSEYSNLKQNLVAGIFNHSSLDKKKDAYEAAKLKFNFLDRKIKAIAKHFENDALYEYKEPTFISEERATSIKQSLETQKNELKAQNQKLNQFIQDSESRLTEFADQKIVFKLTRADLLKKEWQTILDGAKKSSLAQSKLKREKKWQDIAESLDDCHLQNGLSVWQKKEAIIDRIGLLKQNIQTAKDKIKTNETNITDLSRRLELLANQKTLIIKKSEIVEVVKSNTQTVYLTQKKIFKTLQTQLAEVSEELKKIEKQIHQKEDGKEVAPIPIVRKTEVFSGGGAGPAGSSVLKTVIAIKPKGLFEPSAASWRKSSIWKIGFTFLPGLLTLGVLWGWYWWKSRQLFKKEEADKEISPNNLASQTRSPASVSHCIPAQLKISAAVIEANQNDEKQYSAGKKLLDETLRQLNYRIEDRPKPLDQKPTDPIQYREYQGVKNINGENYLMLNYPIDTIGISSRTGEIYVFDKNNQPKIILPKDLKQTLLSEITKKNDVFTAKQATLPKGRVIPLPSPR